MKIMRRLFGPSGQSIDEYVRGVHVSAAYLRIARMAENKAHTAVSNQARIALLEVVQECHRLSRESLDSAKESIT